MRRRTPLFLTAVLLLAACGVEGLDEGMGGFGLPTVSADQVAGDRTDLSGTLHVEQNGCFTWTGDDDASERRWVVWPASASHDGDRVTLGDGTELADGDTVAGTGVRTDAGALPEWEHSDSYFASFGTYCGADERGVVVFDEVLPAAS